MKSRYQGALAAIEAAGEDPGLLRRCDAAGRTVRERSDLADLIVSMQPRPTAVLCGNDMIAIAIVNKLTRDGWSIPKDIAIVGYDDISDAQLAEIPLTTIRQPAHEIGVSAAQLLFERAADQSRPHRDINFTPELVVRESTIASPR